MQLLLILQPAPVQTNAFKQPYQLHSLAASQLKRPRVTQVPWVHKRRERRAWAEGEAPCQEKAAASGKVQTEKLLNTPGSNQRKRGGRDKTHNLFKPTGKALGSSQSTWKSWSEWNYGNKCHPVLRLECWLALSSAAGLCKSPGFLSTPLHGLKVCYSESPTKARSVS